MKIKISLIVALLFLASISLYAEGKKEEQQVATGEKADIQFSYWGAPVEDRNWTAIVEAFEAANPNIVVERIYAPQQYETKLLTMIAGKAAPDVFSLQEEPYITFASKGALLDLTDLFKRDFKESDYHPTAMSFQLYEGKYYALPWDVALGHLFYNKDLFDEAGLKYPEIQWYWDEFLQDTLKLTKDTDGDGRNNQWGFHMTTGFRSRTIYFVYGAGGDFMDDVVNPTKITIGDPEAVKGMQFAADLVLKHEVAPPPAETQALGVNFMAGNLGFLRSGTWSNMSFAEADFEWDVTRLPKALGVNSSGGYFGHDNIAISADTKNKEAAWKFTSFVLGPEGQKMIGELGRSLPARNEFAHLFVKTGQEGFPEHGDFVLDIEDYGKLIPRILNFREAEREWNTENELMLLGKQSALEAAEKIAESMRKYTGLP